MCSNKDSHLTWNVLLHYLVSFENSKYYYSVGLHAQKLLSHFRFSGSLIV